MWNYVVTKKIMKHIFKILIHKFKKILTMLLARLHTLGTFSPWRLFLKSVKMLNLLFVVHF